MSNDDEPKELRVEFSPRAKAEIDAISAKDPKFAEAMREFVANLHQAHAAVETGQYATFQDALEAIIGQRPEPIPLDDDAIAAMNDPDMKETDE